MKIETNTDRERLIAKIHLIDLKKQPWDIDCRPHIEDRSIAINKLSFLWYGEIADNSDNDREYVRKYCKWTFGCSILMEGESKKAKAFAWFYDKLINAHDYEDCIEAMAFIEVTRHFSNKQFILYLEAIERYAAELGIKLTHPDDYYWEAMGIKNEKT